MTVYRITKSKHASDISGTGAALFPGRWNKKGVPVLYTSVNRETALLETLVHIPALIAPKLDVLTLEIPDDSIVTLKASDLPANWFHFPAPAILSEIGHQWVKEGLTVALMVPSCVIHSSSNILLNCSHKEYAKVALVDQRPFYFDTRLRK